MSKHGEITLLMHLIDAESLTVLAQEGLDPEVIPTEAFRPIFEFALNYFYDCGRTAAPSAEALHVEFGDILDDQEIDYDEAAADTVEWAIADLKGTYALKAGQEFVKSMAVSLAESDTGARLHELHKQASKLMELTFILEDRSSRVDVREALGDRLVEYDARVADKQHVRGARFGIEEIDNYTGGIHPGELAIVAGGPKVGKSMFGLSIAIAEWRAGRTPVFFTLENTVPTTLDRVACMMHSIDTRAWAHGELTDEVRDAVEQSISELADEEHPFWVLQPDMDQRTVQQLVREAILRGADTVIIDQLTYIDLPEPRRPKTERIGLALHALHGLITTGRDHVPCILMHQISRDGVKAADREGYLAMHHMAESSEVERTADWVFGAYAGFEDQRANRAKFQTLACRRESLRSWEMQWLLGIGSFGVLAEREGGR